LAGFFVNVEIALSITALQQPSVLPRGKGPSNGPRGYSYTETYTPDPVLESDAPSPLSINATRLLSFLASPHGRSARYAAGITVLLGSWHIGSLFP
jgi:hypothetical protein